MVHTLVVPMEVFRQDKQVQCIGSIHWEHAWK